MFHADTTILTLIFHLAGPPMFSETFPREQVKFLLRSVSFINKEECKENFSTDKFAAARPNF